MDLPREPGLLHDVGGGDVVAPDVVLPLLQADHAAQHVAGVDPDPHVHLDPRALPHRPHGGDHGESHPHDVDGVVRSGDRKAGDTVVAVAQDLDAEALVVAGQLVKLAGQGTVTI